MDQLKLNIYLKNIINGYIDYSPKSLINMTFQNNPSFRKIFKYDFCENIIDFMVKALKEGFHTIVIDNLDKDEINMLELEYQELIIDRYDMFSMNILEHSIEIQFKDDLANNFNNFARVCPIWYIRILLNETELIEIDEPYSKERIYH